MSHSQPTNVVSSECVAPSAERRDSACQTGPATAEPTPRELEVEDLLCRGYSQENIAAIFGRSVSTISAHAVNLYRKRRVNSQVELLLAYLERKGIVVFSDEASGSSSNECVPLDATR